MLVFEKRGKTGVHGEKPLGTKERTNNKLNLRTAQSRTRTQSLLAFWSGAALARTSHNKNDHE